MLKPFPVRVCTAGSDSFRSRSRKTFCEAEMCVRSLLVHRRKHKKHKNSQKYEQNVVLNQILNTLPWTSNDVKAFITDHVAYTSTNKTKIEREPFLFLTGADASHVYVTAWALCCFHGLISTQTFRMALLSVIKASAVENLGVNARPVRCWAG